MIGVDSACLGSASAKGMIRERDFLPLDDGPREEAKGLEIGSGGACDAERVVGAPFAQIEADGFLEGTS